MVTDGVILKCEISALNSKFMSLHYRKAEIDSVSVSIINRLKLQTAGYFYLRESTISNRWVQIEHVLMHIVLFFLAAFGGYASVVAQIYPPIFMVFPFIGHLSVPKPIVFRYFGVGILHGLFTIIIIAAHLKEFWLTNSLAYQLKRASLTTLNYKILMRSNYSQLHFQLTIRIKDIINDLRSFHVIKFIKSFLTFIICLPFFIFGAIELLRITLFISEVLAIKLKRNFLFTHSKHRHLNSIMSAILSLVALTYSVFTIAEFWLFFQVIFRTIINVTTFIVAHSVYFSITIVVVIPYVHYIMKLIDSYKKKGNMLPRYIIHLQQKVESRIDDILTAKQGKLEVYFFISGSIDNHIITIDLPEMLQDDRIEQHVRQYLQQILLQTGYGLSDGISRIVFQYSINDNDTDVDVTLPEDYNHCLFFTDNTNLTGLLTCISQHLQSKKAGYFQAKLSKVYYKIHNIGDSQCIGIPSELFGYLRYYAPEVSLSLWQIFFNIMVTTCIFLAFILAVLYDSKCWSFTSLSSTIANTPIVYIATVLSLKYLKVAESDEEITKEILLANLILYRRGYRLFCRRGIEFQPLSQLMQIFSTNPNPRRNSDLLEYQSVS
ncbi:hypothetical protein TrispH2_001801 [Trichoplax sp. H2]|nr:hypothetical protein TrispH2_001801 [Trichoplax sp. H2]|eukprot:RDD46008.1 hypothetical protein TrispH2_001801 [Trichoplax sp. H2]